MKVSRFLFLAAALTFVFTSCDDDKNNNCGNGILDEGEQCDPEIPSPYSTCSEDCLLLQFCGNGLIEGNEECDDGNHGNNDGCSASCQKEVGCGNGYIDFTKGENGELLIEECDDGNLIDGDGCSATCTSEGAQVCGNGILEYGESCDDGNTTDGDGCSALCKVESGCGDGIRDWPIEICDDGNLVAGDGCSQYCRPEFDCGNGICEEEDGEFCDVCPQDCCPDCGNGILDEGETCEDSNNVRYDGCSPGCMDEDGTPTCGNLILETGEECDDGNVVEGDGCDENCLREFIVGDGICERTKNENCMNSLADCCPDCGNGKIDAGEECDGTLLNNQTCTNNCWEGGTIACTSYCMLDFTGCTGTGPVCGDSTAECSEKCDGSDFKGKNCSSFGYESGSLVCRSNCTIDTVGCSGFLYYAFSDFADSALPDGWTMAGEFALGTPTSVSGPSGCYSTPYCVGTDLAGEYANSLSYDTTYLKLPEIDLSIATAPVMTFYGWVDAESCCDGGKVQISNDGGITFVDIPTSEVSPAYQGTYGWTGVNTTWTQHTVNLTSYIGNTVVIRFAFRSDSSVTNEGWFIDDIIIEEQ
ncbi:DUF4215 domain-containing protein [Myxococcota bacterium]|nr:DUF4215 domain-containing protein [Myxococcota bacterium]MBU1379347.1 DUF4215 domain-containing protein [Myxococcota bacterium]MBU1497049.1 DUF4215 domain-containing protein [Myxococcota bacterium]